MRAYLSAAIALLVLSGCAGRQQITPSSVKQCEVPRPQVCTMEYAPVCADLVAGGAKEYSSGCNACADEAVAGYLPGRCPSDEK